TFILSIDFFPGKINFKEGEVANKDIVAPQTIEYVDQKATEKLKDEAARSIKEVYNLNLASIENVEKDIANFFTDLKEIRAQYGFSENNTTFDVRDSQISDIFNEDDPITEIRNLNEKYSLYLEESTIINLLEIDHESLKEIEKSIFLSIRKLMEQGIREDDLEEMKKQIIKEISDVSTSSYVAFLASPLGEEFLKPSLFLDVEATEKKRIESIANVRDVKNIIRKDQIIIRKGEIVKPDQIEILKILGLQNSILHFRNILGLFSVNLLFIFLIGIYLYIFYRRLYEDINKLILLSIIYVFMMLLAKISGEISGYLTPMAFASMLIAITIDSRLSLWMTFLLSINLGFMFLGEGEISFIIIAFIGGVVAVFSIRKAIQRSSLTRAGLLIAVINVFTIFALGLISNNTTQMILENSMWGALNGIISAILTIGILPFLESLFDITSSFKLMELSNPNQPLLKQLLVEAPGTYHHSVVVGNLAETASEEVGGNALLTRVGAYYHDIGKLKRPYFFSENQDAYKNSHDDMEPSLSALVIASHVKDGVEMAKKYRLPKAIIDIINQHHGTGLISYFFHKALQTNAVKSGTVNEENYRYSGPKPQSKEAGIIMLADILEAEARTLNSPTSSRIKNLTQSVVNRCLENGQLDECNLTLKDLTKIKEVFSKIFIGMFHSRIEYPDEELISQLKKEQMQNESVNKKQTEKTNQSYENKNGDKNNIEDGESKT
ncbi:MAG: HDIG domain-containing protein, partial [Atribacterota bacterium]|nr:HDIG domain-containing protein [Atribacterota bacterium]